MLPVKKSKLRKRRTVGGSAMLSPGVCATLPRAIGERAAGTFPFAVAADAHLRHLPPGSDHERVPEIEIKLEFSDEEEEGHEGGTLGFMAARGEESHERKKAELAPRSAGSQPRVTASWQHPSSMLGVDKALLEGWAAKRPAPPAFGLPVHTRRRKTTSEVWQFFSPDASDPCRAVCTLCQASVGRGKLRGHCNTTALKRHLAGKHPLEWGQRKRAGGRAQEEEEEEQVEKEFPLQDTVFGTSHALCSPAQTFSRVPPQVPQGAPRFLYVISDSSEEEEEEGRGRTGTPVTDSSRESSEEESSESSRMLPQGQGRGMKGCAQAGHPKPDLATPYLEMLVGQELPKSRQLSLPNHPLVPPGTKRRKSTSAVWQFFYIDCSNVCRAVCTLCQASVSRGKLGSHFGTSALMRHLEGKHPLEWGRGRALGAPATPLSSTRSERLSLGPAEDEEPEEDLSLMSPATSDPLRSPCARPGGAPAPVCNSWQSEAPPEGKVEKALPAPATLLPPSKNQAGLAEQDGDVPGKYTPNHPQAQAWNRSIAELLCSMALPCSFVSAKPFHRFMAQADPRYHVPSPAFFSRKAVPQLCQAVGLGLALELQQASVSRVHLSAHVWAQGLAGEYLALAAHWLAPRSDSGQRQPRSQRRQAVLCVQALQEEPALGGVQQVLAEQLQLWLAQNSLSPGFLVSGGSPGMERATKDGGYTHIPCFAHCLSQLVLGFLRLHRSIEGTLGVARAICAHFARSPEARRGLTELQRQHGLAPRRLKQEATASWDSTYYMLERLLALQPAVQEYVGKRRMGEAGLALSTTQWTLMRSLVELLQPFEMAVREASAAEASLSQVLPQVRYLHIFLQQIRRRFESQAGEEAGSAVRLAESLALQLSTEPRLSEMFHRQEYVLATLLDPRFKGRMEAILPLGSDLDHWKQLLVRKVKELLASPTGCPSSPWNAQPGKAFVDAAPQPREAEPREPPQDRGPSGKSSAVPPLIQKEKTLTEHLESVGLLASEGRGASLPTESHSACVMVERYLQDNRTIGAREDPLGYWEKRHWLWPALAKLAMLYLSCPPSGAFSERIFTAPDSPFSERRPPQGESTERLVFLRANLGNFPDYPPPPLICSENDSTGSSSREEGTRPA
ncbi:zinc finger BED domain-containing protein 6-like isoform X1 [Gopherus evgoodei]|uniref:Zinc finger BED domain-containing protein 6-like n=1 Tax=Gopherus evgoodei TaxID=1825980 RepID=A0A8C4YAS7_9SAUR|nr:zinc finger BED domain-containing protein 6-like isoform X1 [Gopherus evgoodei]XP_030398486.1 zinc finger BED domain-containing protein 6-like isoform X1 [Gopherus evgoodei]XP_030398487.1 zinc finger BED domain-containing protein 6-like isoform X1 [Gopherus evgoodei]XP_030398488.1 zinc finger BED domain-containing protein 6-like isoform X1 [Gopherus evgoodei]